jgi:hypothetical protein
MEAAESQRARFYAPSDVSGTCFRDAMFAIAGENFVHWANGSKNPAGLLNL